MNNWISLDLETYGSEPAYALQPWRVCGGVAGISCFATGWHNLDTENIRTRAVWMKDDVAYGRRTLEALLSITLKHDQTIVAWNAPFDVAWLLAYGLGDLVYENKWIDGMHIYRRLVNSPDKTAKHNLKAVVNKYFPRYAGYEEGVDFDATDAESRDKLMKYNRLDAMFTLTLAEGFWKKLTPAERRNARIEAASITQVAEANLSGLTIHRDNLMALDTKLIKDVEESKNKLLEADPEMATVNLNSPKQLATVLFDRWGLMPLKKTGTGARSTDKETLHELALDYPLAKVLRDNRSAVGDRAKFVTAIMKSLDYNKSVCTHPLSKIFGTYTGRMTVTSTQRKGKAKGKSDYQVGFALHQMKRSSEFRRIISSPQGYVLLGFDFAGQEYRWMAVESGDEAMLGLCQPGEDAHTYMAGRIGNIEYRELQGKVKAKEDSALSLRFLGKVGNLSCQYRTSAKTLRRVARVDYGIPLDQETSERIHRVYRQTYPGVPQYWRRQIAKCKDSREVWTLSGRKVLLPDTWDWSSESTAINFPIQGVGTDQKYLALHVIRDYLNKVSGKFYFEMHDELFFIVPTRYAERAATDIKVLLSNLPYKAAWGLDLPINFPVDAKLGSTWGDLQEWCS